METSSLILFTEIKVIIFALQAQGILFFTESKKQKAQIGILLFG